MDNAKTFYMYAWYHSRKEIKELVDEVLERTNERKYSRVVVCCSEEYRLLRLLEGQPKDDIFVNSVFVENYLLLGANRPTLQYLENNVNVFSWPNAWFYFALFFADLSNISDAVPKYLYMCLNNQPHLHRIKTVNLLKRENLLDKGLVTWRALEDPDPENTDLQRRVLPSEVNRDCAGLHVLPREYNEVLFIVVTETTVQERIIDLSEKTVHAILAKRPFIIIGNPNSHKLLKQWDFELYTELFDYSFDSWLDPDRRIEDVVRQIKYLNDTVDDYEILHRQLCAKAEYNFIHLLKIIAAKDGVDEIFMKPPKYAEIVNKSQKIAQHMLKLQEYSI